MNGDERKRALFFVAVPHENVEPRRARACARFAEEPSFGNSCIAGDKDVWP
jgi:hypothetical protein